MFRRKKKAQAEPTPELAPEPVLLPTQAVASLGGWLAQSSLQLDELYGFLSTVSSDLSLDQARLQELHRSLRIVSVAKEVGYLSYVRIITQMGIEIRYYEDGLYVLELTTNDPVAAEHILREYHQQHFRPTLEYVFSLGAPLPKTPQSLSRQSGLILSLQWPHPGRFEVDERFGRVRSSVSSDEVAVYYAGSFIFVVSSKHSVHVLRDLVDMQTFFDQVHVQLQDYLAIQRRVWADTAVVAERRRLPYFQLAKARALLFDRQKAIDLAHNRLQQMSTYVSTRAELAEELALSDHLSQLFHFRFATTKNSLEYVVASCRMTAEYVQQTAAMIESLSSQWLSRLAGWGLVLLCLVTISSLVGWLQVDRQIAVEHGGFMAVLIVLAVGLIVGWLLLVLLRRSDAPLRHGRPASATTKKKSASR